MQAPPSAHGVSPASSEEVAGALRHLARALDACVELQGSFDDCAALVGVAHGVPLAPREVRDSAHGAALAECAGLMGDIRVLRVRLHHLRAGIIALDDAGAGACLGAGAAAEREPVGSGS